MLRVLRVLRVPPVVLKQLMVMLPLKGLEERLVLLPVMARAQKVKLTLKKALQVMVVEVAVEEVVLAVIVVALVGLSDGYSTRHPPTEWQ